MVTIKLKTMIMVNMSKSDKAKFVAEVHHRVVRKFPRRHVFVTGLDEIWAMDLISYETDVKLMMVIVTFCVLLMSSLNLLGVYR